MEPTLDGMAAPLDFTPWTSKVKTFSKSTAVAMQMHAMFDDDLSMETAIVALQAKLSAACKEVLWKDVLLQKLETTLKHADERADANQVELEHALLEHAKQTMLVASLDTKLRECEDAHAATRLSLADMQIQRTDLVDRCAALARDMSVAQQMRDQSDRGCREWKERCAQLESERRQHMQALHAQQHEAFQLQIKHENLQRSLQRLEDEHQILLQQRRTCFPRHAPTNPPAARCDQGSQCTMPDVSTRHAQTVMCAILDDDNVAVEAKRAAIARQQDLMTIASQAKQLQVLQAALDHWQATCRRTVQAYEELRSKANMWKGCVATLLPIYQEQVNSLELAKSAKAEWTKAKQSLEADGRRVAMQLEQVQGMLRQANDQLAIDHQLLVDSKKREKTLGRNIKSRETKARELVATLHATQTKLDALQAQYTNAKAESKRMASRTSQIHTAWLQERADRLQAVDEIEAFRVALIECCQCAVSLQGTTAAVQTTRPPIRHPIPVVPPPTSTWTLEHLKAVTGIAEPLVFG